MTQTHILALRRLREHREADAEYYGRIFSEDDYIFARPDGTLPDPIHISRVFKIIVSKAGLKPIRLHDLRHTHATLMLKAGIHPKVVSERLGHANIGITMDIYSHVLPGLQEAAAEKFDRIFEVADNEKTESNVSKMLASEEGVETRPCRSRTCDPLIKSQMLCQLS
jgi:integrase